jgi:hypothetical protein
VCVGLCVGEGGMCKGCEMHESVREECVNRRSMYVCCFLSISPYFFISFFFLDLFFFFGPSFFELYFLKFFFCHLFFLITILYAISINFLTFFFTIMIF